MADKKTDPWKSLGHDNFYRLIAHDGEVVGLIHRHITQRGETCQGYIPFAGAAINEGHPHCWTLVNLDPLTLDPSLNCTVCLSHGYIREGAWVPV